MKSLGAESGSLNTWPHRTISHMAKLTSGLDCPGRAEHVFIQWLLIGTGTYCWAASLSERACVCVNVCVRIHVCGCMPHAASRNRKQGNL